MLAIVVGVIICALWVAFTWEAAIYPASLLIAGLLLRFVVPELLFSVFALDRRWLVPVWRRLGWRGDGGTFMLILTICLSPLYLVLSGAYRIIGLDPIPPEDADATGPDAGAGGNPPP